MSHLCGVCLGLRDHAGQGARATTNVDAVVLSVLVAAQRDDQVVTRKAGPCPGRGGHRAIVPVSTDGGVALAVATSLTMAATKIDDHVLDHDGAWTRVPVLPRALSRRWRVRGDVAAAAVAFDAGAVRAAVDRSNVLELDPHRTFDELVAPTEDAAAVAFVHTAVVADRPGNHAALDDLGRAFGRIVYLLDAVADHDDDIAHGRFNPLAGWADGAVRRTEARRLFGEAHERLTTAFERLDLIPERTPLLRALLVDQVARSARQVLHEAGHAHCAAASHHQPAPARRPSQPLRAFAGMGLAGLAALSAGAFAFKPGQGPEGFDPQTPPPVPPEQPASTQEGGFADAAADMGGDCLCSACTCCVCDSCDCCDCCDC